MTPQEKRRDSYLKRMYGITLKDFNRILKDQKGCCPVCLRKFRDLPGTPHVDHNHLTGEIRGLLCAYDNHRVVGRHRDPELLRRVADYVEGPHTGFFAPKKKRNGKTKRLPKKTS